MNSWVSFQYTHCIDELPHPNSKTWRSTMGDLSDDEWELIADLFPTYSGGGRMGRPPKHSKRDIVNAIYFVSATGCQWRSLPKTYPNWNTVHRYHLNWSRDGVWERVAERLHAMVRLEAGRDEQPSAAIIDARSVRGASTVTSQTRGYDAGKKISGRKTFGVVDTLGILISVVVVAASVSDNAGGIAAMAEASVKSSRLEKVWCDGGFKRAFIRSCQARGITAEVVRRIHPHRFVILPRRWIVERTWSWIMNNRRLQIDYERDPEVARGFVWVAQSRLLLRRLTEPATGERAA